MGEITEMVLDGILCDCCGGIIDGHATGHPRQCINCKEEMIKDLKDREGFYKRQF